MMDRFYNEQEFIQYRIQLQYAVVQLWWNGLGHDEILAMVNETLDAHCQEVPA